MENALARPDLQVKTALFLSALIIVIIKEPASREAANATKALVESTARRKLALTTALIMESVSMEPATVSLDSQRNLAKKRIV